MKKLCFILALASLLCACDERPPKMEFKVQMIAPFTYQFTNLSKRADSYKWDFGDGAFSYDRDVTHKYAPNEATYIVTLTGTKSGIRYDCRKTLAVKKPNIYVSGWGLNKIPYANMYYKMRCEDDNLISKDIKFRSPYTPLLDNSDMPYYYKSPNRVLLDTDEDAYYTFYVYYTSNNSTDIYDQQVLKQKLTREQILLYQSEYTLKSNNGDTELVILFEYE